MSYKKQHIGRFPPICIIMNLVWLLQYSTTTPSGRKVCEEERKGIIKERIIILTTAFCLQRQRGTHAGSSKQVTCISRQYFLIFKWDTNIDDVKTHLQNNHTREYPVLLISCRVCVLSGKHWRQATLLAPVILLDKLKSWIAFMKKAYLLSMSIWVWI